MREEVAQKINLVESRVQVNASLRLFDSIANKLLQFWRDVVVVATTRYTKGELINNGLIVMSPLRYAKMCEFIAVCLGFCLHDEFHKQSFRCIATSQFIPFNWRRISFPRRRSLTIMFTLEYVFVRCANNAAQMRTDSEGNISLPGFLRFQYNRMRRRSHHLRVKQLAELKT